MLSVSKDKVSEIAVSSGMIKEGSWPRGGPWAQAETVGLQATHREGLASLVYSTGGLATAVPMTITGGITVVR